MHIPGKLEASKRTPGTRFFHVWQITFRLKKNGFVQSPISEIMAQPHAQKVAKIAGDKRRISTWQKCCEQANKIAEKRRLARLAMRDLLSPDNLALYA